MKNTNTFSLVQFSILLAAEAIFCFTPLGSLPALGPIVATLAMLPIIITALLMGVGAGTLMGFFGGLFSFFVWTFTPPSPLVAFVFTPFYSLGDLSGNAGSLVICFVPRILVGTVAGAVYRMSAAVQARSGRDILGMAAASALGSLTNTLLVMGGVALFFGRAYASALGASLLSVIGLTILTSGLPEAVVAAVVCPAVCRPILSYMRSGRAE